MEELRLGFIPGTELYSWFKTIEYTTYSKAVGKYLRKLESYCEFERVQGGIIVKEIYCYKYYKNIEVKDRDYILKEIRKKIKYNDGLATMSGLAEEALHNNRCFKKLSYNQAYYRVRKTCLNLFGKIKKSGENFQDRGTDGSREYEWAVKLPGLNLYRRFTQEEKETFLNLVAQYGRKTPEQLLFEKENLEELRDKLKRGESIDENLDNLEKSLYWFNEVVRVMNDTFQISVARATKHQVFEIIED